MTRYSAWWPQYMLRVLVLSSLIEPMGAASADPKAEKRPRADAIGDPLPEGAVARIGTVRLRQRSTVCSVAFSPDGKLLATGGQYDGVWLWDASTGKQLRFLPAKGFQGIFHLAFSPDGKTLVSSDHHSGLEVWDVATGKKTRHLRGKFDQFDPLCFSDDGKLIAASSYQGILRVWETAGWTEREPLRTANRKIVLDSFAGKRMIVRDDQRGKFCILNVASLEKQDVPKGWRPNLWTVLSPDGKRIATPDWDTPLVELRDVATGKVRHRLELGRKKDACVIALCYSPDGKMLAAAASGIQVYCFDSETGKERSRFGDPDESYHELAFSADGKRLAVACGHAIRIWEIATSKELLPFPGMSNGIQALAFSPNGKQLAFSHGNWLSLYDTSTRKPVWRRARAGEFVHQIGFAPDGKTLVAGNVSSLQFHDAVTGRLTQSWPLREPLSFIVTELRYAAPDLSAVVNLEFPKAENSDTAVHVLHAAARKERFKFQYGGSIAQAASISASGRLLAIGCQDAPIRIFRIDTGAEVARLELKETEWHSLVFAPDGRTVAAADPKGTLHLLEVSTGKNRLSIQAAVATKYQPPRFGGTLMDAHRLWMKMAIESGAPFVLSPDGNLLVTWNGGPKPAPVRIWNTLTGRELGQRKGHGGQVLQAAFAPDGKTLATASEDTTILLWDMAGLVRSGKPVPLAPQALDAAWQNLADADAVRACRAMAALHQSGTQGVEFLRSRVRVEPAPTPQQIDRWIKELDHAKFAVRKQAVQELENHIDFILPALRKTLVPGLSLEMRRRLMPLIEAAEGGRWSSGALRTLRVIELLERLDLPEARAVLKTLADGPGEARLTQEAKASLQRLAR